MYVLFASPAHAGALAVMGGLDNTCCCASTCIQPAHAGPQALAKLGTLQGDPMTCIRKSKAIGGMPWWNDLVCEDTSNSLCTCSNSERCLSHVDTLYRLFETMMIHPGEESTDGPEIMRARLGISAGVWAAKEPHQPG